VIAIWRSFLLRLVALFALLLLPLAVSAQTGPTILHAADAGKILPNSVYFDGQSASTQLRNSAGVRFADGKLVLAVLVDSSGYSGDVHQKYQGYFIAEVPLSIGDHRLPAGAYGMGVVSGQLVVMDIGAHDLFESSAPRDPAMVHPVPLQIMAGTASGTYRLCIGRNCVEFRRTP
jgi:hypothetical protein